MPPAVSTPRVGADLVEHARRQRPALLGAATTRSVVPQAESMRSSKVARIVPLNSSTPNTMPTPSATAPPVSTERRRRVRSWRTERPSNERSITPATAGSSVSAASRSATCAGGRALQGAGDPAVAQEHDAVGDRGGGGVVGDHHHRPPVDGGDVAQDARAPRPRRASRGCPSARRPGRSRAPGTARGRSTRAAADRRTARRGCARRARKAPPARAARERAARGDRFAPAISAGRYTFSVAVSDGSRLKNWKTKPRWSRRRRVRSRVVGTVDPLAGDGHLAGRRSLEPSEHVQQRALARSRGPHDRDELAARRREVDVVERPDGRRTVPVVLAEPVGLDGGVHAATLHQRPFFAIRAIPWTRLRVSAQPTLREPVARAIPTGGPPARGGRAARATGRRGRA